MGGSPLDHAPGIGDMGVGLTGRAASMSDMGGCLLDEVVLNFERECSK